MSSSPSRLPAKENKAEVKAKPEAKSSSVKVKVKAKKGLRFKLGNQSKPKTAGGPQLWPRLVIFGILALVLIGGAVFSANKLKALVKEVQAKRSQLTALEERETSFVQLKKDFDSLTTEAEMIDQALVKEAGIIDLLEQIENLKEELEIEVNLLSFSDDQPRQDPEGHPYVELTIEANGELGQLKIFLEKLLDWPYLLKTKVVDLNAMDEVGSQLIFRAWLYVDQNFFDRENDE
jgi:hypothetical protein